MDNSNKPAFPSNEEKKNAAGYLYTHNYYGLTKREYIAAKILQGIVSGYPDEHKVNGAYIAATEHPLLCSQAIEMADELLKQLRK